jgi:hypothetical protein
VVKTTASIIAAYSLLTLVALLLRLTIGEMIVIRVPLGDMLGMPWFPALILFLLTFISRRWLVSTLLAPIVLIVLITFGPAFLPRMRTLSPQQTPLRLKTYNLHAEQAVLQPMIDLMREADHCRL